MEYQVSKGTSHMCKQLATSCGQGIKVAGNPVVLRSTNLEIHADRLFVFLNC